MVPGPAAALDAIGRYLEIEAGPIAVRALLVNIIVGERWLVGDEAAEKAQKWERSLLVRARAHLNACINDGSFIAFTFNTLNPEYIQGACYCEPSDPPDIVEAKRRRRNSIKLFDAIRVKTANDLEILCVRLLTLLGVKDPRHTPRSGDGGIDFYGFSDFGYILKPEILPAGAEKNMRVWFVGQAKHFDKTGVSTKDIREIVGSAELARAKLFAGKNDPVRFFSAKLCDPVFSMFVTTGEFSRDSKDLMKKSGIIPMDGPQLGQFLADNNVGLIGEEFDDSAFDTWLYG
ncbi:restriction endonuclease [Altererythrobacter sp. H2]|uniref:restriction endonuclease n=1 Tax=Altererythrobacter sp. H2 TaxID=3108391 RepID=UPI002B4C1193|nr:restriction endonuclease [Altererythrobacter sp. H2]WRK95106.1 restriction endonuclease [Altererythrobacter sp. H2]